MELLGQFGWDETVSFRSNRLWENGQVPQVARKISSTKESHNIPTLGLRRNSVRRLNSLRGYLRIWTSGLPVFCPFSRSGTRQILTSSYSRYVKCIKFKGAAHINDFLFLVYPWIFQVTNDQAEHMYFNKEFDPEVECRPTFEQLSHERIVNEANKNINILWRNGGSSNQKS
mgnify:CR=1 FL=1